MNKKENITDILPSNVENSGINERGERWEEGEFYLFCPGNLY
jgi:hypothetical protein